MGTRAPYLSPGLTASIAAAEASNQRLADAHPDAKPSLVDGHWLIDDISYASGGLSMRDILDQIADGASE